MVWAIVILALLALAAIVLVVLYNRFVRLRNRVDNAWAQIEVQLKRRWDLIPNLVETVKGYAAHERATFEEVTQARTAAQQAQTPAQAAEAEGFLAQAENRIALSRQVYNDTMLTDNNSIQAVPGVFVAGPFGFDKREFFDVDDDAQRDAPQVSFTSSTPAS